MPGNLSELPSAAKGAAAAATAALPPRPSISQAGPMARAASMSLRLLHHSSTALWGWGRNDCGEWDIGLCMSTCLPSLHIKQPEERAGAEQCVVTSTALVSSCWRPTAWHILAAS
jgi:hypothetical protein